LEEVLKASRDLEKPQRALTEGTVMTLVSLEMVGLGKDQGMTSFEN
jgi:hypothetical protein